MTAFTHWARQSENHMASEDKRCYINSVKFIWLDQNREHVTRSGHLPDVETWERVFLSPDVIEYPSPTSPYRFVREAMIDGLCYRIAYSETGPNEVFPLTGHRIPKRRRRRA